VLGCSVCGLADERNGCNYEPTVDNFGDHMREAMSDTDEDVFALKFSDDDLEAAAGNPTLMPTFTCSQPMCATGGGCGTWTTGFLS
jgi:hypothetical protein